MKALPLLLMMMASTAFTIEIDLNIDCIIYNKDANEISNEKDIYNATKVAELPNIMSQAGLAMLMKVESKDLEIDDTNFDYVTKYGCFKTFIHSKKHMHENKEVLSTTVFRLENSTIGGDYSLCNYSSAGSLPLHLSCSPKAQ